MGVSLKENSPTLGGHRGLPLTRLREMNLWGEPRCLVRALPCSSLSNDITVKIGDTEFKNLNAMEVIGSLDGRSRRAREILSRDNSDHGIPMLKIFRRLPFHTESQSSSCYLQGPGDLPPSAVCSLSSSPPFSTPASATGTCLLFLEVAGMLPPQALCTCSLCLEGSSPNLHGFLPTFFQVFTQRSPAQSSSLCYPI